MYWEPGGKSTPEISTHNGSKEKLKETNLRLGAACEGKAAYTKQRVSNQFSSLEPGAWVSAAEQAASPPS
jgi:hypothetical protein